MKRRFYLLIAPLIISLVCQSLPGQTNQSEITFADPIASIIHTNCSGCHNPNGIGPFSLVTYEEISRRSRQITEVIHTRFMPPWKPDPGFGPPLQGARYLSESEIELINEWARLGSPSGDLEKAPTPPLLVNEWKLGEPDLVIDLSEAYMLPAEGLDVYRNFVIPLPIEDTIYVRAFELLPETRLAIHHALLMFDPTNRSRLQDESESGPGYDGMGIGSSKPPSGHIVGWTPGQVPYQAYPGTAWELNPGTDLVLQLHMLPSGKAEQINPKIGLYLSKEPPSKPSFVFQMRSYELDIPAGESDYLVEQSLKVTAPIRIISVYPHAHYIGKDMQLFATLPDGSKQWLLRISDWDFNWQGDYRYEEPLFLPEGSVIHMAYHFDNSAENIRNPFDPPKKIQGGWRSEDEMAEAMIQVLPVDPADLSKLQDAQKEYDFKLAGGEARFHYFSGIYLEQQNEFERAITSFKSALTLDPTFASAYFQIGAILEKLGNPAQAEDLYEEALAYQPDLISARLAVAKLMMQKNQIRQAGFILEDVYANNPEHLLACIYLARYYMARGEIDSALKTFQEGDKYFKDAPQFHLEYGQTLLSKDRQKAEQRLIQATDAIPDKPDLGSIKPLKKIHSEAFYQLALLYEEDAKWPDVENALDQCLQNDPDHLDALLKSAATAIRSNDTTKAFNRLLTLVDKPEKETFSREDIVANLPLPVGAKLLAEAYQKSGQKQNAVDSLTFSIKKLQDEGKSESTISLEALRDNYLEDIGN